MTGSSPLYPYFDVALISYEQGICKPDPEMFRRMTEQLDVKADECLYVGDGGSRELYAAREAGMHPVQCTWFRDMAFEPHIPCAILDEFDRADRQDDILKYIYIYASMYSKETGVVLVEDCCFWYNLRADGG